MDKSQLLADNVSVVKRNIDNALKRAGRTDDVVIVGASKTMSRETVKIVDDNRLLDVLGENRVQELLDKYDINNHVKWHFIGTLQTNKVRQIIDKVELIHSLDRYDLAAEIDKRAAAKGIKAHCLVQLNMGEEPNKSGFMPNDADVAIADMNKFDNIVIDGVMAVMPIAEKERLIALYKKLNDIYTNAKARYNLKILSAGMTNDYELAVEYAGSNMVRIGRAIFGERYYIDEKKQTQ